MTLRDKLSSTVNNINEMRDDGSSHDALLIIDIIKELLENGTDVFKIFTSYGLSLSDNDHDCKFIELIIKIASLLKDKKQNNETKYIVHDPSSGIDNNWHVTDVGDTCVAHCYGFSHDISGGKDFAIKIAEALAYFDAAS